MFYQLSFAEKEMCFWCVAELAGTIAVWIAGGFTGVGITECVAGIVGVGEWSRPGANPNKPCFYLDFSSCA